MSLSLHPDDLSGNELALYEQMITGARLAEAQVLSLQQSGSFQEGVAFGTIAMATLAAQVMIEYLHEKRPCP